MAEKGILKAITGASFLLVLIGSLVFLYAQSFTQSALFPENVELWNKILTGYLVIFALGMIGALALTRGLVAKLATANYWKSFLFKFVTAAVLTIAILILIKGILKGPNSIDLFQAISYMPISVLLLHMFVVTQIEEILFGGLIFTSIQTRFGLRAAYTITAVTFAIYHFAKTQGNFIVMLTYIPLRLTFDYVKLNGIPLLSSIPGIGEKFFGPSPYTQQINASVHFGWNAFIIGFINPLRI